MPTIECCKTCQHCGDGQVALESWCRLRKLSVHAQIAHFAFCHHWTQRDPALPKILGAKTDPCLDRQLELDRELVSTIGMDQ